jgi:putative oxidoreductase
MTVDAQAIWMDRASKEVLLIWLLVGWVFLSGGIQKFLFPESLGFGRFVKIGIPWPQVMTPLVEVIEIACGSLLLIGLIVGLVTVPLLVAIAVAVDSTKIVTLARNGFWGTLHETRTDVSRLLGLIFLLLVGAGAWSLDVWLAASRGASHG